MTKLPMKHMPRCEAPELVHFQGKLGDYLARCRTCGAIDVIETSRKIGECVTCGAPTQQNVYQWCGPCHTKQKKNAAAVAHAAPTAPADPTTPSEPEPETSPTQCRVCPDCLHRPARDQRPATGRGRCHECHQRAIQLPNRKPRHFTYV